MNNGNVCCDSVYMTLSEKNGENFAEKGSEGVKGEDLR
jgi:hypothetical protein